MNSNSSTPKSVELKTTRLPSAVLGTSKFGNIIKGTSAPPQSPNGLSGQPTSSLNEQVNLPLNNCDDEVMMQYNINVCDTYSSV